MSKDYREECRPEWRTRKRGLRGRVYVVQGRAFVLGEDRQDRN